MASNLRNYDVPPDISVLRITEQDMRTTPKPSIVNVVATFDLWNASVDAETLTLRMPGFCFNPQKFAAIKMRQRRTMTLAFYGGRAVCPGARSVEDARLAAIRFAAVLVDAGELVCYRKFRVQNIVCSVWAPFEVELDDLIREYSGNAEYKKDKFPGLAFRLIRPAIVFNVFNTGRVVITGSKSYQDSCRAWYWFMTNVLVRFRRGTAARSTSSAAYKIQTQRVRDTLAEDCNTLAGRHARRADGPLANSEYGQMLRTPRSVLSRSVTPISTPRSIVVSAPAAAAPEDADTTILFSRIERSFPGHTIHCGFVRGCAGEGTTKEAEDAAPFWRECLRDLECALAVASDEDAAADAVFSAATSVLSAHQEAGCIGIGATRDRFRCQEIMCEYMAHLHVALGDEDAAAAKAAAAKKRPRSAVQELEAEDLLDAEAMHLLDQHRAGSAFTSRIAGLQFCPDNENYTL